MTRKKKNNINKKRKTKKKTNLNKTINNRLYFFIGLAVLLFIVLFVKL